MTGAVTGSATEGGAAVSLDGLANASDVNIGDILSVVGLPSDLPDGVAFNPATQSFTLDPTNPAYRGLAAGETQVVTVAYAVSDGIASVPGSVAFTITGTNNAPVVTGAVTGATTEDGSALTLNALANASDPDRTDVLRVTGTRLTG